MLTTINKLVIMNLKEKGVYMKKGFTLAEVLITISIIGIVAALTMPSLMGNHRKKELESRFKKAHAITESAILRMSTDYPYINVAFCGSAGADRTNNKFIQAFSKYFNITASDYTDSGRDLTTLGYKQTAFYQSGPGKITFNADSHNNGAVWLNNGMMIASAGCWWAIDKVDFIIDTNGRKGPNKTGYDVFYFQIGPNNELYPSAGGYFSRHTNEADLKSCCNFEKTNTCAFVPADTGFSCSSYAMRNQYPHDETKTYWESLPNP